MRLEIRMPKKSEFSDDGKIAKWLVSVGDVVAKGDPIADVEVDMTTEELIAEADGKIVEIWVHAGQSVPVETVIAMQSVEDEAVVQNGTDAVGGAEDAGKDNAAVDAEETTDETSEREEAFPEMSEEVLASAPVASQSENSDDGAVVQHGHVLASPSAVQLAEQYNVNLETLAGTGSCGRIEREDVEAAMQTTSQFITPEDVDDLMNFAGDFSSEFSESDQEGDEQPALAGEQPAEKAAEVKAEESEAGQYQVAESEESVAQESGSDQEVVAGTAAEPADDQTEEPVHDQPEQEVKPESAEEEADQSEEFVEGAAPEVRGETADESVAMEIDAQSADEEFQPAEQESEPSDEIADVEQQDEVDGSEESAESSVIYMGAGPESVDTADEEQEAQPESVSEPAEEEPQEVEISVDVSADEEQDDVATEFSGAAEEVSEQEAEEDSMAADGGAAAPVPGAVSAYEPTEAEREAVVGFSAVSSFEHESEALAVDESDTIEAEKTDDIGPAVDEELAAATDPAQLDSMTVATAIEQATADASRKSVKVRRLVARKMEQSWQHAPHFFVTVAVDMTDVIRFRSDLGVTINDFILAATTRALQEHPWVNSHFVDDEAVEQDDVNISLAVETEQGLFYPVLRNCGGKAVKDLGIAAAELVVKAHSGKLTDEEMAGGSFTISNMGMLGVESFSAIITPPQVAVLAIGTVRGEVIIDEHEEMAMAPMVRLTLSADHRALDGADAADFLGTMKSYLEAPITLVAPQDN